MRPRRKENRLVDIRMQMAGAEATVMGRPSPSLQTSKRDVQEMAEDIGLLQNTVVRASLSKLPSPTSWEFYSYFWTVLKSRFTGLYTRSHFQRCVVKKGIKSYLPVDFLQQGVLKNRAKKFYKRYYESLAKYVSASSCNSSSSVSRAPHARFREPTDQSSGDAKALRNICLPPLAASLRSQIAARGPVKMTWHLHRFKSVRIVSHRCAPLGGDQPYTSYRQCIVRLESEQTLITKPLSPRSESHRTRAPVWTPSGAANNVAKKEVAASAEPAAEAKQSQTIVEYLVMQTRVINRKEEDWKIWGFTGETTPAKMEEDEAYWKKMLEIQTAAA